MKIKILLFITIFISSSILLLILFNCGSSVPPPNDLAPPLGLTINSSKVISFWTMNNEENFVGYNVYEVQQLTVSNSISAYVDYNNDTSMTNIYNDVINMYPSGDQTIATIENSPEEAYRIYTAFKILDSYRQNRDKQSLIRPEDSSGVVGKDSRLKPASVGLSVPTHRETNKVIGSYSYASDDVISEGNYVAITAYDYLDNLDSILSEVRKVP